MMLYRSGLSDLESMVLEQQRMAQGYGLHRFLRFGCHSLVLRSVRIRCYLGDWTSNRTLPR